MRKAKKKTLCLTAGQARLQNVDTNNLHVKFKHSWTYEIIYNLQY